MKEAEEYELVCGVCEEPMGTEEGVLVGDDNLLVHKDCEGDFEE